VAVVEAVDATTLLAVGGQLRIGEDGTIDWGAHEEQELLENTAISRVGEDGDLFLGDDDPLEPATKVDASGCGISDEAAESNEVEMSRDAIIPCLMPGGGGEWDEAPPQRSPVQLRATPNDGQGR